MELHRRKASHSVAGSYFRRLGSSSLTQHARILAIALTASAVGAMAVPARAAWTTQTIEAAQFYGSGTAVCVQPTGQVHVSYRGAGGDTLKCATNAYGSAPWSIALAHTITGESTGQYSEIAVDSSGAVHVTFYNDYNHSVLYATNGSGAWAIRGMEGSPARAHSAVATDSENRVHVLTVTDETASAGDLHYTTNAGGSDADWTAPVTIAANVDEILRIAVDSADHVHAVYVSGSDVRYATNAGGSWSSTLVEANVASDSAIALSIDAAGHAHTAYFDNNTLTLRYATNAADGTTWVPAAIESFAAATGVAATITTDAFSKATVNYFNVNTGELKQASNASGSWQAPALLTTVTDTASDASIASGSTGEVHLVYIDSATGDIKYLTDVSDPHGADLQVTQTRTPDEILIGRTVEYDVTVTDLGVDDATAVLLVDHLPAGSVFLSATGGATYDQPTGEVRWEIGDLAKGASVTTTISVGAPGAAGTMTNEATVSSAGGADFKSANDTSTISDPVVQPKHELVCIVADNVGGTLAAQNGQAQQLEGTVVPVVATPDPGYRVMSWQGTQDDGSTATTNTVLIGSGEQTVVSVRFEKIRWHLTGTVAGGHGTISPTSGDFEHGTVVSLLATPDHHYRVKRWTGTNNDASAAASNSVTMDRNRSVAVEFALAPNQAPVAIITAPSTVHSGDQVFLNGSASYDPDGDSLTYLWEEMDAPHVTLLDATAQKASFIAPAVPDVVEDQMLVFRLTVSDGELSGSQEVTVKVLPPDPPCGPCGCGVGPVNLVGFYVLCWAGLVCMKWGPRSSAAR
jgi:uncharacterized repeat protein (TIGR01451 family)